MAALGFIAIPRAEMREVSTTELINNNAIEYEDVKDNPIYRVGNYHKGNKRTRCINATSKAIVSLILHVRRRLFENDDILTSVDFQQPSDEYPFLPVYKQLKMFLDVLESQWKFDVDLYWWIVIIENKINVCVVHKEKYEKYLEKQEKQ